MGGGEDGVVKISLNTTRQKSRNLMAQPRPGESRVGIILRPVRVNVIDLRRPPGRVAVQELGGQ
jgi:hypothetical protein